MSTWDYRVFKRPMKLNTGETRYEFFIAQALSYGKDNEVFSHSPSDENIFWAEENVEELKETYKDIGEAFNQPVLEVPMGDEDE